MVLCINAEGRWNLEPGNYLVVSDGNTTKDLMLEEFTFDVFRPRQWSTLGNCA